MMTSKRRDRLVLALFEASILPCFFGLCVLLFTGCGTREPLDKYRVEIRSRYPCIEEPLTVPVFNPFNETALVTDFLASCSCSIPVFEPTEIAAHSRIDLPVSFDTSKMSISFPEDRFPDGGLVELLPVMRSKSDPSQTSNGIPIEIAFQLKTSLRFDKPSLHLGSGDTEDHLTIECEADVSEVRVLQDIGGLIITSEMLTEPNVLVPVNGQIKIKVSSEANSPTDRLDFKPVIFSAVNSSGRSIGDFTVAIVKIDSPAIKLDRNFFTVDGTSGIVEARLSGEEVAKIRDVHVQGNANVAISDVEFDRTSRLLRFSARVTTEKNCLSIVIVSIERSGDTDVCVPVTLRFAI